MCLELSTSDGEAAPSATSQVNVTFELITSAGPVLTASLLLAGSLSAEAYIEH